MTESKLLEVDKDEWFYQSMPKYSNLYMFELEFPLNALDVINETSLCISGMQAYSKKCEILQLCVPPKLLRAEDEEGLCKDRDFKILSGGYTDSRILQIKSIPNYPNLVSTLQDGLPGVVIYEVGNDDRAIIREKVRLSAGVLPSNGEPMALCSMTDKIILGAVSEVYQTKRSLNLYEWNIGSNEPWTSSDFPAQTHSLQWKNESDFSDGHIVKMKEWDNATCIFLTNKGTVALYDFRTGTSKPGLLCCASKATQLQNQSPAADQSSSQTSVIFSFDCISKHNKIGIVDSCGGYESLDARYVYDLNKSESNKSSSLVPRTLLPDLCDHGGVYSEWFNIEYEPWTEVRENASSRFIISGLKKENIPVFQESQVETSVLDSKVTVNSKSVDPVFSHDGHSKSVSHLIWHPVASNLVFSASVDAVLHAWQFIPNNNR